MAVDPGDYYPPITAERAAKLRPPLEVGYDEHGPAFPLSPASQSALQEAPAPDAETTHLHDDVP